MKVIATADLHGHLPTIPECDLLLIAGDMCPDYFDSLLQPQHGNAQQLGWLVDKFKPWLEQVPAENIVGIAGNHDFMFEMRHMIPRTLRWRYLKDETCIVDGLQIHGVPWVPNVSRWAFYARDEQLEDAYGLVPDGTDIILSHGPPRGYGDEVGPRFGGPLNVGAEAANRAIRRVTPAAFVCGHIHEAYGQYITASGHSVYNVAHVTDEYVPINKPVEIPV